MPKKTFFETKAYARLLQEVKQLFSDWDRLQDSRLPEQDLRTFWTIGQKLERTRFDGSRTELLSQLSRDLQKDRTQLLRFQQFFRQYSNGIQKIPGRESLTWAHYQETLAIADPQERDFYLNEAARDGWPSRRIRTAAQAKLYQSYQLGRSKKHPHGTLPRFANHFYVYRARVEQVVDPYTLRLLADQGFDGWQHLTGRLRGLNAPELHGPQSELALQGLQFVQESLSGLDQVVVQSHKAQREKYGRYLIDVFFHPTWEDWDKIIGRDFF